MWQILNQTQYQADRAFARDRDGAEHWIVAVRATFRFDTTGNVELAPEQQPVKLAPEFFGEPGKSSLRYDTDIALGKRRTDVIVNGSAHAPGGRPARQVDVSVSVGPIVKSLRVAGDRFWVKSLVGRIASDPIPFQSIPIRYERAFGGSVDHPDGTTWNPVGRGAVVQLGDALPNIDHAEVKLGRARSTAPAGFGAIAPHWSPRAERAGTYDDQWEATRKPLLPTDFDDRHRQCAPDDQQTPGWLRGGEPVTLDGLTPEGLVRLRLPRVALGFDTHLGGKHHQHTGELHTVIIEPDDRLVVLVWQTALRCHGELDSLRGTTVYEKKLV